MNSHLRLAVALLALQTLLLTSCTSLIQTRDPARGYAEPECAIDAYFVGDLCPEEKRLLDRAAQYPRFRELSEMTAENLQTIADEAGSVDYATAVFYQRAITHPVNRRFLHYVARTEHRLAREWPDYSKAGTLLVFVPGMFYEDLDIRGLKGEPILEAARSLSLPSVVVPLDQTGTVRENAAFIRGFLREHTAGYDRVLVVTASKGGTDFGYMLSEGDNEPFIDRIKAWFNIGGILAPSMLVDVIESRWSLRVRAKLFFGVNGYDYRGFRSMGPDGPGASHPLGNPAAVPGHIEIISIVGVPLSEHVTNTARPFYRALRERGPNDGFLLLGNTLREDAILYPAWRNDHYFQWSLPSERIAAFLVYAMEGPEL
jgi:hypothetical protein